MATVTARTETVTVEVEVKKLTGYALELSKEEAEALHDIVRRVGGLPESSRRRFTDAVETALRSAGVPFNHTDNGDLVGHIYFS